MGILYWDKVPRKISIEDWKEISADSAPPGVYQPNMSDEDMRRFKAKLVGHMVGKPQVEIRFTADRIDSVQILVVVSLGQGINGNPSWVASSRREFLEKSKGINVAMSMNGRACMTFTDLGLLILGIEEAKQVLENLDEKHMPS